MTEQGNCTGNIYFISDFHLGADTKEIESQKEKKLLQFLRTKLHPEDYLYILGDMFDFWFEYRHAIPKDHFKIVSALMETVHKGISVSYVAGNHDYWIRDFFTQVLGVKFYPGAVHKEHYGKRFLLLHGDGLRKKESGYRMMRRIFRSKINIFLYQLIHPDIGVPFARWISHLSRLRSSTISDYDDSEYLSYAKQKFENGIDYVIIGHTHRPVRKVYNGSIYLNIGDWTRHFTYGMYDRKTSMLKLYWWED